MVLETFLTRFIIVQNVERTRLSELQQNAHAAVSMFGQQLKVETREKNYNNQRFFFGYFFIRFHPQQGLQTL